MAISNDLLSSTLYSIRDTEVDELYKKVAFLDVESRSSDHYQSKSTAPLHSWLLAMSPFPLL
jgi:hypothetical protein